MTHRLERKPKPNPDRWRSASERDLGAALAVLESAVDTAREAARPFMAQTLPGEPRERRDRRRLAVLTHASRDCVPSQIDDLEPDAAGD